MIEGIHFGGQVLVLALGIAGGATEQLDIEAAYRCFRVKERPSRKSETQPGVRLGDMAPGTRHIAGKLVDSQQGMGGTLIWNPTRRVDVPISAAKLALQNAAT